MQLFEPRTPEHEVMNDGGEVEAYASAAAQRYLDSIDNTLVKQLLELGRQNGIICGDEGTLGSPGIRPERIGHQAAWSSLLDVGTGPGAIPLKMARACPQLMVVGVDRSRNMTLAARRKSHIAGAVDAHNHQLRTRSRHLERNGARACADVKQTRPSGLVADPLRPNARRS